MPTRLTQTGAEVQDDLYKIEDIGLATEEKAGLMSPEDKAKLDNIDAEIPTKLSDLEEDPTHRTVTDAEKQTWNNKSDFSGRYQDLTGRPFIPTKTGDLVNNSGFITRLVDDLANYYLKSDADALFATIAALNAEVSRATGVEDALQGLVDAIVEKIPVQASADNPLADKAFVNSSIATATAEFKGTYNSVGELPVTGVDNNDYAFVRTVDAAGNTVYKRYKYNGSAWVFEYDLNNSSFTSEQWAAVNSGITAALVSKLSGLPNADALTAMLAGKQDVIQDLDDIRAGATAGATAYQKPASGIPASDLASGVIPDVPTDVVQYISQSLTDAQKRQARDNIDAKRITTLVINRTWTYAQYQVYAQNGNQQSWTTTAEYANQISKGDIFTIKATISDRGNCEAYLFVQAVSNPPYAGNSIPAKCLIASSNKITQDVTALSALSEDATHRLVTDTEKSTWNNKYTKPSTGIPASDLATGVIPEADNAITDTEIDTIWNNVMN